MNSKQNNGTAIQMSQGNPQQPPMGNQGGQQIQPVGQVVNGVHLMPGDKIFSYSFCCCCCSQDLLPGQFLGKTFMTHIIIYIISSLFSCVNFIKPPGGSGGSGNSTGAYIGIIPGIIIILLNFMSRNSALKGEYTSMLNCTTTINCLLDLGSMFTFGGFGILLLLLALLMSAFASGGSGNSDTKSVARTLSYFLFFFSFSFLFLAGVFVTLMAQSCTACSAASELKKKEKRVDRF